jgi:RNA polymerase sigma factor (sigma-70 family)
MAATTPTPAAKIIDWAEVLDRLLAGDPDAYRELSALVTRCLARMRAHDLRQDWEDLVQEVLLATVVSARAGRIRSRAATLSYIRRIAHHKHTDRLRRHIGARLDADGCWEEALETGRAQLEPAHPPQDTTVEARRLLERLPEKKRQVVFAIHGQGLGYDGTSALLGIPRTTMRRTLRAAMQELQAA